jgi:hypothetical protein
MPTQAASISLGERSALAPGVTQSLVRPVLPARDHPLIEPLLRRGDRPDDRFFDIWPSAGGVTPRVPGHVLAEQGIDGLERPLHDALAPYRQLRLIRAIGTVACYQAESLASLDFLPTELLGSGSPSAEKAGGLAGPGRE